MIYKVYIQSLNNFPIADWAVSAYLGFKEKGTDVILFEDIEEVPTSPFHIVVADIESTNSYLERFGLGPKMALNIPECIEMFTSRKIWRMTMGEYRKVVDEIGFPIFIKPNGKSKEFIAGILENKRMYETHISGMQDNVLVLLSEVVDFVSEYRCYIVEGELKGIYFYKGDFRKFPDINTIDIAISTYSKKSIHDGGAPAGYSMDFGITSSGETLLIECNDGWSLGNYGLEPSKYCLLLGRRWRELMIEY